MMEDERKRESTGTVHKQIFVALTANVPSLVYGLLIGWVSATVRLLQSAASPAGAPLSELQVSLVAGVLPFAGAFGTPLFSLSADRYGRRNNIIAISVMYTLSWTLKLVSAKAASIITARVLAGLASGGLFVILPIYVREISQDSIRGALGLILTTAFNSGILVAYILGNYLSYRQAIGVYLALPVLHIVVFSFLPESPAYLVKRQRFDEAAEAIAWLRNVNRSDTTVMNEIDLLKKEDAERKSLPKTSIRSVVNNKPAVRALRMGIFLIFAQTFCGCFAVINYASVIFERANTDLSPENLTMLVGGVQLVGCFVSLFTVERFGRKILLAGSSLSVTVCMGTIATWFLLVERSVSVPDWVPIFAVCVCIFSYAVGLVGVPFVVIAEIFSFQLRARLAGLVVGLSWVALAITVGAFVPVANAFGEYTLFYVFTACSLAGAAHVLLCVPETRGKSFAEIERQLAGRGGGASEQDKRTQYVEED